MTYLDFGDLHGASQTHHDDEDAPNDQEIRYSAQDAAGAMGQRPVHAAVEQQIRRRHVPKPIH